jgi:hypothetical protein
MTIGVSLRRRSLADIDRTDNIRPMDNETIRPTEGLAFFRRGRTAEEMRMALMRRTLICADGFRMSVQAHSGAWSEPSDNEGPWWSVEVATVGRVTGWNRFLDHGDAASDATGWRYFYAHVPLVVVETLVSVHGGIIGERG